MEVHLYDRMYGQIIKRMNQWTTEDTWYQINKAGCGGHKAS